MTAPVQSCSAANEHESSPTCPRPVMPDHSVKACVESGNCGCDEHPKFRLSRWLSAALEDPAVCEEMKADIRDWFESWDWSQSSAEPIDMYVCKHAEIMKPEPPK